MPPGDSHTFFHFGLVIEDLKALFKGINLAPSDGIPNTIAFCMNTPGLKHLSVVTSKAVWQSPSFLQNWGLQTREYRFGKAGSMACKALIEGVDRNIHALNPNVKQGALPRDGSR